MEESDLTTEAGGKGLSLYDAATAMGVPFGNKAVPQERYVNANGMGCKYLEWGDTGGPPGNLGAAGKAVEAIDQCLARSVEAIEVMHGELLITADHGNVEQMLDTDSGQPLTSHTNGPVPLVYVGGSGRKFLGEGCLSDIAPTLLSLLDMPIPSEMTGQVLMGDAVLTTGAAEDSRGTD